MWKQQEANAHGRPCQGQPLLYKRHGPAAGQGHGLPPVQAARGALLCAATQTSWKHLERSEELIKVQLGHGDTTCSDLFKDLGPYLRENRSTLRTPKWLSARQESQGIRWPAKQTARCKRPCPGDEAALVRRLRKKREELEQLEDKVYEEMFRAIFSSLDNKENTTSSRSNLTDPPSPVLEPAAGHLERHSAACMTKDAAGETQHSEPVSLDQLLAELSPVSHDSLSCDTLVKELLENWEQEELPDTEAAGQRDREPESALFLPRQEKEGGVLRDASSLTLELVAGSQGLHSISGLTKASAGETDTETAPPDRLAELCSASADEPSCDAFLNKLLEKWEEGKLLGRAAAGERDSEAESPLSHTPEEEEEDEEAAPSSEESDPCGKGHSELLPRVLPEEAKGFAVCAAPADAADEADAAGTEAGRAQAAPAQEKPCGDEPPAGACPTPAQPLARSVPACPAGSAAVPQPPAPRRWRSMAKRARRALRRLFSCSCLRGQPEE
ncbi:uncharacterized protein LOC128793206 [Vidua chalybeata]|uniref:uncharacterized protein LOC128793206 n=1 Tax=Vidua chalybeata TaxID=81927 RepID=UPI0023A856F4|nr:uncharacterized protein LOC128793206 [Vidua chalybeata]